MEEFHKGKTKLSEFDSVAQDYLSQCCMLDEDIQEKYYYNTVEEAEELLCNAKVLHRVHGIHTTGLLWMQKRIAEGLDYDEEDEATRFCYKQKVSKDKGELNVTAVNNLLVDIAFMIQTIGQVFLYIKQSREIS